MQLQKQKETKALQHKGGKDKLTLSRHEGGVAGEVEQAGEGWIPWSLEP